MSDRAAVANVAAVAARLRRDVIEMVYLAGSGHTGGSLSSADIVAALYWSEMRVDPARPDWPERDRLVLSKGHCAPLVYAALARRGYFDAAVLRTFRKTGSLLQGHPDMRRTRGLDMTSGSLGHGLSVGLGMALASRQSGVPYRTFVLQSDGEMQEGMTWEAAMAAAHHGVGSLTAIVDRNRLQVDGWVSEIVDVEPLAAKWAAFGWQVIEVDGHDISALLDAFEVRRGLPESRPAVLICHTTKGKGVSFMEDVMEWHGGTLSPELYERAVRDLGAEGDWRT
jgi:transketolase